MINFEDIERVNADIKTTPIKGKDYAEVPQRVKAFRKLFPNGCISTSIESLEDGVVVMKTLVSDEEGKLLATGYAYEKKATDSLMQTVLLKIVKHLQLAEHWHS